MRSRRILPTPPTTSASSATTVSTTSPPRKHPPARAAVPGARRKLGYPTPSGSGPYPGADYQPTSSTDPQNNQTTYSYDTTGNLTQLTLPAAIGASLKKTYQGDSGVSCGAKTGQLCASVDARGRTTAYSYDSSGNLAKVTPPAPIGATTVAVDGDSRVASVTDGRNIKTTYTYDADNRIVQVRNDGSTSSTCATGDAAASRCVSYTYDTDGNLTNRLDAAGAWTFSYDQLGRLSAETTPPSVDGITSQAFTYDASSNLTTFQEGSVYVGYTYDAANELISLAEPGGSCSPGEPTPNSDKCTTFGYNPTGQRTTTSYPTGELVTVGYDNSGRETSVLAKRPGGAVIVSRSYLYTTGTGGSTDTDLRQSVTDQAGTKTSYTYDVLNRIKTAVTGATTLGYTYDPDGNIKSMTKTGAASTYYGYNDSNELCWSGKTRLEYRVTYWASNASLRTPQSRLLV